MYRRLRILAVALLASIPSLASAQRDSVPVNSPRETARDAGPTVHASATGFRQASVAADSSAALQRRSNDVSRPVAIMLVGAAAIVLGAVVDNDVGEIIVIGGVVAVLYGLYQYLK